MQLLFLFKDKRIARRVSAILWIVILLLVFVLIANIEHF